MCQLLASLELNTTDLIASNGERMMCDLHNEVGIHFLPNGGVVAEFHHMEGATPPVEAYDADIIVCCHPEHLPSELRIKHVAPNHIGPIATSLHGGFDEPVVLVIYTA